MLQRSTNCSITSCSTVVLLQTLRLCVNQMHVEVSLGNALHVGSKPCLYEFTELNFLSVGSQLPPRTLNTLIETPGTVIASTLAHDTVSDENKRMNDF